MNQSDPFRWWQVEVAPSADGSADAWTRARSAQASVVMTRPELELAPRKLSSGHAKST